MWRRLGVGVSLESNTSFVVALERSLKCHFWSHFKSLGFIDDEATSCAESRSQWYGTIDAIYRHLAITELMEYNTRWANFEWFVTIFNGVYSIDL